MAFLSINSSNNSITYMVIVLIALGFYVAEHYDKLSLGSLFNLAKEMKTINMKTRPSNLSDKDSVLVGYTSRKKPVYISDSSKHVFVCGTTGSGKTVALSNFIKRAIDRDYGLVIVDGKGDVGNGSILDMTRRLINGRKKLYVINLNDPYSSDKYNPFHNANPTIVKDMLINMTEWTEPHYKFNCERYLQRAAVLQSRLNIPLCFGSIIENLSSNAFTKLSMELMKLKVIDKDEHLKNLEILEASGKASEGAIARFATIAESELGTIFDISGIDIITALEENAIILFVLNPLIYSEVSPLIGKLILIDSKKAVSKLYETSGRRFFIFDEIATYGGSALLDIVNKSRAAGVTCVLATQGLSDLNAVSEHFREQIVENCNNYIILRQNSSINADSWASILGTKSSFDITYQLQQKNNSAIDTGYGSLRSAREFLFHPDEIKKLQTGNGYVLSRDDDFHAKVIINKPV